jgi:hypothetical protein
VSHFLSAFSGTANIHETFSVSSEDGRIIASALKLDRVINPVLAIGPDDSFHMALVTQTGQILGSRNRGGNAPTLTELPWFASVISDNRAYLSIVDDGE